MLANQLLFFFSALGAFNGFLLTAYLAFSGPASMERRLLAGLLFVISIRISKSIWFYFDPSVGKLFLQIGLSACLLIGPLLFEYINCEFKRGSTRTHYWKWHLSVWLGLIVVIGLIYPYNAFPELWGDLFYRAINFIWGAYILIAILYWYSARQKIAISERSAVWQLFSTHVLAGTSLIWLAYFTASYTSYIVGALSFSFILYLTILLWIFTRREKARVKYAERTIDSSLQESISLRLSTLMEEHKLYKNANLTLSELARRALVSVPVLSQFLNDNLQKSFSIFVNEYRINESKRILIDQPTLTMDLIAEASGYNSQSTFYAAFKQFENSTPAKYRKKHV